MVINKMSTISDAANVQIDVNYPKASALVNSGMKRVLNGNWRIFKKIMYPSFERFALDILLEQYLGPVFNQVACQDFINF